MAIKFKVARTFKSSLMRQIWEAVKIHGSKATIVLNSLLKGRVDAASHRQDRASEPAAARRWWGKEEVVGQGGGGEARRRWWGKEEVVGQGGGGVGSEDDVRDGSSAKLFFCF